MIILLLCERIISSYFIVVGPNPAVLTPGLISQTLFTVDRGTSIHANEIMLTPSLRLIETPVLRQRRWLRGELQMSILPGKEQNL